MAVIGTSILTRLTNGLTIERMNRAMFSSFSLLLAGLLGAGLFCSPVDAQPSSPEERVSAMLLETIRADGVLTKEKHDAFWRELNKLSAVDRENLLRIVRGNMIHAYQVQAAIFDSARLSYQQRKAVKTDELLRLEAETRSQYLSSLPKNIGQLEKDRAIRAFDQGLLRASENQKRILEAAAARTSVRLNEYETLDMTLENIEAVRLSLRLSIKRAVLLIQPQWEDEAAKHQMRSPGDVELGGQPKREISNRKSAPERGDRAESPEHGGAREAISSTGKPEKLSLGSSETRPTSQAVLPDFNLMSTSPADLAAVFASRSRTPGTTGTLGRPVEELSSLRSGDTQLSLAHVTERNAQIEQQRKEDDWRAGITFTMQFGAAYRQATDALRGLLNPKLNGVPVSRERDDEFLQDYARNFKKYEEGFSDDEREQLREALNKDDYERIKLRVLNDRGEQRVIEAKGTGRAVLVRLLAFAFHPLTVLFSVGVVAYIYYRRPRVLTTSSASVRA